MADGSHAFNFPIPQRSMLRPGEIVVDLFAGGGGASEALKQALGMDPALAYNHDEWAIGMHAANHPLTDHHREDIWHADPRVDVAGRPVGWFHFSPDCTHFSQAKGGQPRSRKIRSLAWVGAKWIGQLGKVGLAPRIVSMENVWQMLSWCPLVAKRDKATGRVLKMDGTVAAKGERVPVEQQQLVPDKKRLGQTWGRFVEVLRGFGYAVEWRKLIASDYGAGTSRERLFLLARRDGEPIRWPEPTHGPGRAHPLVPAAASIDFSDLGVSIFDRPRPLADATMRRIARGVVKHVLQADEPFFLTEFANAGNGGRTWSAQEPLRTQCAGVKGGHFAMVSPVLVQTGYGEREGQAPRSLDIGAPLGTIVAGGVKHAVVSAFLEQACGGYYTGAGNDLRAPAPTICAQGSIQRLVSVHMEGYDGCDGRDSAGDTGPALRGASGWDDLAAEAPRQVWPSVASDPSESGASNAYWLPRPKDGGGWEAAVGVRASRRVDRAAGANPRRNANQPSRWRQDEQSAGEPGAGDLRGEHVSRLPNGAQAATEVAASAGAGARGTGSEGASGSGADVPRDRSTAGDFSDDSIQSRALRVAAFLISYYGQGQALDVRDPLDTVTTRDRMALVTVYVHGEPYVIVDIKLRMLKPAELFRAQGFPPDYIIDRTADGRRISNTHAVRMVGNSVSPPPLRALAEANLDAAFEALRKAA